ncbi:MAG: hypothetical protein V7L29_11215 [Nostoc sp.]|uniref:hypothetical protein n=1 Tax=Nostoc sp. TaxID=1180 RepID=UPI002FEFE2E0
MRSRLLPQCRSQSSQTIEPPKNIESPPDIGYWIDTGRVGDKPCAKIHCLSNLLEKPV